MVIHDRFVFLHVPKTGGRFVRKALLQALPDCRPWHEDSHPHLGWDRVPGGADGRPVLAFVRNPWDWYVSFYSFVAQSATAALPGTAEAASPLTRALFTAGSNVGAADGGPRESDRLADFRTTVRRACTGIVDDGDRAALERLTRGWSLAGPLLEGRDLYSAQLEAVLGEGLRSDSLTLGRFESLTDDLTSFLAQVGIALPAEKRQRIATATPLNSSGHAHYRECYDAETKELVGRSCKALIDRFDYRY